MAHVWELVPGSGDPGQAFYTLDVPDDAVNDALGRRRIGNQYNEVEIGFGRVPGRENPWLLGVSFGRTTAEGWGEPDTAYVYYSDMRGHRGLGDVELVTQLRDLLKASEGLPPDCKETLDRMIDYAASLNIPGQ